MKDESPFQANYPVSKFSYYAPWLTTDLRVLNRLKSAILVSRIYQNLVRNADTSNTGNNKRTEEVVSGIFADLQITNREKGSVFVLVYLPIRKDYMGQTVTENWRRYVQAEAVKNNYFFVDIVEELRSLPPRAIEGLFSRSHGHYTDEGNKYVSDVLYRRLSEIPEFRRRSGG
jgi:hypothetical protein